MANNRVPPSIAPDVYRVRCAALRSTDNAITCREIPHRLLLLQLL